LVVIGIDAHMRSHTAVAVDAGTGRRLAAVTVTADEVGHRKLVEFAAGLAGEREWAIEDCRNLSRHLEKALLSAGERVVRVPPKLMARARRTERTFGKSDPLDALAVARAALREDDLPVAQLAGPEREIALLLDHRANLIIERTRLQGRLRWLLYELDPTIDPAGRSLDNFPVLDPQAPPG
jgi:transposase